MPADAIRIERPTTNSKLFAHTRWDAVPAAAGLFHLAYLFGLYFLFPHTPLWVMLILGFVYSLMVNANINGVGHNFIHNPFFRLTTAQSPVWNHAIDRLLLFADDVRRRAYATSQGELRPAG